MITQILYEATSLVLALIMGIFAYPHMNKFMRILFFQLLVWILFYITGYAFTYYQATLGLSEDNHVVLNIYISLEFLFLITATSYLITDKISRSLNVILSIFFAGTLVLHIIFSEIFVFANYAVAMSGFSITILYTLVLYKYLKSDPSALRHSPEAWVSLGLVIYAACNVPYFTMFHYLNKHHPELSEKLFHIITDVLANIRYFSLALAFWFVYKNRPAPLNNATT